MTAEFVKVAKVADVQTNSVKVFEVNGKRIALCHADGEFFAVADLCTHDDGPLGEGELTDHQIECPRHGARFDVRSGKALCLPAILPVPTYKVEVRKDEIYIGV
jgi:3-phenylpropionate/trans-cinnamate dioxygenase ferredoxin subunit